MSEECFQRGHLDFAGNETEIQWTETFGANQSNVMRVAIPRVTAAGDMTTPKGSMWARVPIPSCRLTGPEIDAHLKSRHKSARFNVNATGGSSGALTQHCPAPMDCAGCCATVPIDPATLTHTGRPHPVNETWWRAQDCVAACADNGNPGSCGKGEAQFAPPLPGLASLWSTWCWGDAPRNATEKQLLKDSPTPGCDPGTHDGNMMMKVNIVDRVVVPPSLHAGEYMLSWRWDCEQSKQVWQNCADLTLV